MKDERKILYDWKETRSESSFRLLYESLYHPLLSVASGFVEHETAKDIVQETFLRIWNSPENYSAVKNLRFYLYRTIRNECLNHIRDKKVEDKYRKGLRVESDDFFYHVVLEEEIFIRMQEAIDSLPDIYREVLVLSLDGMRDKAIAEKLNISIDNVKTRKKRARMMLKDLLYILILLILLDMLDGL